MNHVTVSSSPVKVTLRYGQKGERGIGISSVALDENAHLIVTYDDGKTQDAGAALGDVTSIKDGIDSTYKKIQASEANVTKLEASTKTNAEKAQQALQNTQSASVSGVSTINSLVSEKMTYMTTTFNSMLTQAKANIDQWERDAENKIHKVRTYSLEQIKTAHDDAMVDIERSVNKAEAWAVSEKSPDRDTDMDSPTGLTQSSRSWALYSKGKIQEAINILKTAKDNVTEVSNMKNDVVELLRQTQASEQSTRIYMNAASASRDAAKESADASQRSAEASARSAQESSTSATASAKSADKAATLVSEVAANAAAASESAKNASVSETNAANFADSAKKSEAASKASETNAKASETASAKSAENAEASAAEIKTSEINASNSAARAAESATKAAASEANAKTYETESSENASNASTSAGEAKTSETNAANSESNALQYKNNAEESKVAAATSAGNASKSEANAKASMNSAAASATSAGASATNAATSESHAATSETNAKQALVESQKIQKEVESALTKVTGFAKYAGSVDNYSDLPLTGMNTGDVWNIVNADPAHQIKAGDNVIWNGKAWDNLSGFVDLSNYPTNADVAKAVVDTTYSGGTITFIHKDGTKSTATIGDTSHATQADQDGEGNVITDTYYKKADASVIHQSFQNQIDAKQDKLTFDESPVENSDNPVKSKGINAAIASAVSAAKTEMEGKIPEVDESLSSTSENPVQNKVVTSALNEKVAKNWSNFEINQDTDGLILSDTSTNTSAAGVSADGFILNFASGDNQDKALFGIVSMAGNPGVIYGIADRFAGIIFDTETQKFSIMRNDRTNSPIATEDYVRSAITAIASYDDTAF